ncbi:MAG TPA: hypothetical protein VM577_09410 [Anaerovoracaceae bacterium]|nr:hypothetical protein [Anaerovoracaceae bacterium]
MENFQINISTDELCNMMTNQNNGYSDIIQFFFNRLNEEQIVSLVGVQYDSSSRVLPSDVLISHLQTYQVTLSFLQKMMRLTRENIEDIYYYYNVPLPLTKVGSRYMSGHISDIIGINLDSFIAIWMEMQSNNPDNDYEKRPSEYFARKIMNACISANKIDAARQIRNAHDFYVADNDILAEDYFTKRPYALFGTPNNEIKIADFKQAKVFANKIHRGQALPELSLRVVKILKSFCDDCAEKHEAWRNNPYGYSKPYQVVEITDVKRGLPITELAKHVNDIYEKTYLQSVIAKPVTTAKRVKI